MNETQVQDKTNPRLLSNWLPELILIGVLVLGAYFRWIGLNWDESQHLHPDERFLTMVEASLKPVGSLGQYFDTATSTLNPHNTGYGFFVYGTLPIFIIRYLAEAVGQTGYDQVFLVGRAASAAADLLVVFLVYLIAQRMFRKPWLSLLAAAFYAGAVLPIQLSHYMAVDTFTTAFGALAFYFAVVISTQAPPPGRESEPSLNFLTWLKSDWRAAWPYLCFGAAYGMALASKISIVPLAILLPAAAGVAWSRLPEEQRSRQAALIVRNLVAAGLVAFLVFRIGQPYAFKGPGFFGILPNEKWFNNLQSLQVQSSGDGDTPPELQWARRPVTFAWDNLVTWGLGLPLGLLATLGFVWMGWRIVRGGWRAYGLIWVWSGAYFLWQGLSFTRAMRYQVPIYPFLVVIAAWMVFELGSGLPALWKKLRREDDLGEPPAPEWPKILAGVIGVGVALATFAWAFAFTRIYSRPMTRVEASRWIYENAAGPINLQLQTDQGSLNRPLSYPTDAALVSGRSYPVVFSAQNDGLIHEVQLTDVNLVKGDPTPVQLGLEVLEAGGQGQSLGSSTLTFQTNLQQQPVYMILDRPVELKKGQRYVLNFTLSGERNLAALEADLVLKTYDHQNQIDLSALDVKIEPGKPFLARFTARTSAILRGIRFPLVYPTSMAANKPVLVVSVIEADGILAGNATLTIDLTSDPTFPVTRLDQSIPLQAGKDYLLTIDALNTATQSVRLNGLLNLQLSGGNADQILPIPTHLITPAEPFQTPFTAPADADLSGVSLGWAVQQDPASDGTDTLVVTIHEPEGTILGEAQVTLDLRPAKDQRGRPVQFQFPAAVHLEKNRPYFLKLAVRQGRVALRGSAPAMESSWDDALPLRLDGMDGYGGVYQQGLNFEMYWNDDANKLARFTQTLDQADYLLISSNRQWGTTTRVPERYPLTSAYYRSLLGCPAGQAITWCYSVAEPGMFQGQLGFELVKVFQSDPNLGPWRFNTQFAEEAFTVYDHPKVLIFRKSANYSAQTVRDILGEVDLSKVIQVTPRKASRLDQNQAKSNVNKTSGPGTDLMLPADRLAQQQAGGTWSEMFDRDSILNLWPALGAIVWYGFILLLGWMVYPLVRLVLGGLSDRGYPLARVVAMVLVAYPVWLGGSFGIPFTRTTIWLVIAGLLAINLALFAFQRRAIWAEIRRQPKYYLLVEGLFLAFFILDLLIRLGNPDLWHPAKGGEKPMDFSYLNAVLKSTSFPPYDPWFAGGYINYYYYGFVLIGTWMKALGIVPAVAYNLALPTLFAMVALGAFSIGWNLIQAVRTAPGEEDRPMRWFGVARAPFLGGIAAALAVLILGNLGTINMIWEGFQLLVVPRDVMEKGDLLARFGWMFQGLGTYFSGQTLPYNIGEWYWNPSRAIPGEPITEFPFFTFLYADPHAHMMALPVTILALAWGLSMIGRRWNWGWEHSKLWGAFQFGLSFLVGGLIIGALYPTNTWDMPAYLILGCLAVLYTALRYARAPFPNLTAWLACLVANKIPPEGEAESPRQKWIGWAIKLIAIALPAILLLVALTFVLYQPFTAWYGQGYNSIERWTGDRTPLWAYNLHWGVFLFVLASWLVWETIDWMAKTPVSALRKLRAYLPVLIGAGVLLVLVLVYLLSEKIQIAWVPLLMGTWVVALILRPGQPDAKRVVLFMTGSALALSLFVDVFVIPGAGRMNMVFKFYLQAWTLFALSAGAALIWLLPAVARWDSAWGMLWQAVLVFLVGCAALFPLLAGHAKIEDRMTVNSPHTLDGMAYMLDAGYSDEGRDFKLDEDYRAILWMQEHIQGSPVIVEANTPEYRWGSRFTIYTGLPGVVGWNWHQRQQRTITPSDWVTDRVAQIGGFYSTPSENVALDFLQKYHVKYIVVGQLERAYYPTGLDKFEQWNGKYWKEVYRDGETAIYEVLQ